MTKNRPEHPADESEARETAEAPEAAARGDKPSFEDALVRLEAIVRELEEGRVGLAEALSRYEEGVGLLGLCHGLLERAERRIELLAGVDAEGNPIVAPFDDAALTLEEKAAQRGRRRSAGESPGKPRKSTRPSKPHPRAGQDPPESPERSGPSLFDEGAKQADDSDLL
jgi:exodeoxyribonuclease VII small subunit